MPGGMRFSRGAAYRNRTDDLRISMAFSCVARAFKGRPSFMFAGCRPWRALAVDGSSGASRARAVVRGQVLGRVARRTTVRFSMPDGSQGVTIRCNRRCPGMNTGQRGHHGHHGAVSPVGPRALDLTPRHRGLMPENQDLRLLDSVTAASSARQPDTRTINRQTRTDDMIAKLKVGQAMRRVLARCPLDGPARAGRQSQRERKDG